MDNTSKDNKNRHLLSFAGLLTHLKVFRRVFVNCLAVGHTHEVVSSNFIMFICGGQIEEI